MVAVFEACNRGLHVFRFKDRSDCRSGLPSSAIAAFDQPIGTRNGSQTAFQLVKRYASGVQSSTRTFAGTVVVTPVGVLRGSGWSADPASGIITFLTAPDAGVAVTEGFELHVPVRFYSDTMDVALDIERLGSIRSIPLVEISR